jgi:hypothetical protein
MSVFSTKPSRWNAGMRTVMARLLIALAGVGALIGAVLMLPWPLPAVDRLAPSSAQLAVARQHRWNIPTECSTQVPVGNGRNLFIS